MLALLLEQLEAKVIFIHCDLVDVVLEAYIPRENFETIRPENECDPVSVNDTSGSTGIPKGAISSHSAAHLNPLAAIFRSDMRQMSVFLWTVDMFRCNRWCFTWAVAALGGTNVFLGSDISAKLIFNAIGIHKVTHLCGAPNILNIIADAPADEQRAVPIPSMVDIFITGALPAPQVPMKVTELGFNVSHGYDMTEALGAATIEPWEPRLQYSSKLDTQLAIIKRREGRQ
ncbi:putative acyl-activating enzyme 1, peroxisomal [Morella rubra]|uniref:Putative acyl-activating enzyme 1, peroxisomal n=1 Tax=Morella rubra TaxID=262757 RepID=A0A6A1VDB1_9ROSI|nr:putative acyl-activating enzyme 1, peroxisomal [Morella rubra]